MVKTRIITLVALFALVCLPAVAQKTSGHVGGGGHTNWKNGAPAVNLSKTSLSFGSVTVGTTSAAQTVTLTNTGTLALSITSIVTTSPFANTTTCTGTLAAGSNCTISITFHPTSAVAYTGTTTITDNAKGSPHVISLSGLGGAAAAPIVQLSATSLSFAGQQENTTSQPQTVTVTNVGTAVLNITSIVTSSVFADTTTCAATLAASASCTISVTFTPTGVASYTASTTITDDAADSPQIISLAGSGISAPSFPVVNLSTSAITFADQIVNTTSTASVITLTNVGSASLTISSIAVTGADAADFAKTTTCGGTLAAGARCTISPTFTPLSAASFSAAITITDDASGSPHSVTLSGTGITSPPPTTLFSDDFSSGDFSSWDAQNNSGKQSVQTTIHPSDATHAAQFLYQIAAGGAASQDTNVWASKILTAETDIFYKAELYVKTPEVDATTGVINQRKLIWVGDSTSAANNVAGSYQIVLDSWSGSGGTPTSNLHLSLLSQGTGGACGLSGLQRWEIATLNYDTWYSLVWEVKLNTAGVSDGQSNLWVNGTQVYAGTSLNLRGTCSTPLTFFSIGEQTNRTAATTVVDEYRYWTNVVVSTTGP